MNNSIRFCGAALACGFATQLAANTLPDTNFSYTNIGIELVRTNFDETLWIANEGYDRLGGLAISGSYQVQGLPLAFFGAASSQSNDGRRTELSTSDAIFGVSFPLRLADRIDLVPAVGHGSVEAEACLDNLCAKADDSGIALGIGARMWLVPDALEFNVGYQSISFDEESESALSMGVAGWFEQHHSLRFSGAFADDANSVSLGYRYSW